MARRSCRPRRQVVVMLTAEDYDRLEQAAIANERDPGQQARWLLRGALEVPACGAGCHPPLYAATCPTHGAAALSSALTEEAS